MIFFNLISFVFIFLFGIYIFNKFFPSYEYEAIQQAHIETTPRIGGLLIIICLLTSYIFQSIMTIDNFIKLILCCSPILYYSVKEDIYHCVGPKIRFIALSISSILLLYIFDIDIYSINISIIQPLLNFEIICFIFFAISLVGLANGCNMIDGVNGLSSFYFLTSFIFLDQVFQLTSSSYLYNFDYLIKLTILSLIVFICFNYPLGKIFLGDHGNYFLALLLGVFTIHFYSINLQLNPWGAILLLFYPIIEAIFTIMRRIFISKKNILHPDTDHLHSKLFAYLKNYYFSVPYSNNFVLPILLIYWLLPSILFYFFYNDEVKIYTSLLALTILYIINYIFISKLNNINQDESYKSVSE